MNNVNATIVGAIAGDGGTGSGNSVNNNSVSEDRGGAAAAAAAAVAAAAAAVASARGCNANNTGSSIDTSQQLSNTISITTGKILDRFDWKSRNIFGLSINNNNILFNNNKFISEK